MTELATPDAYGRLIEPATLKIERLLPGPVEHVWAYLTDSDLRRQWLAAGDMPMRTGAPFTLTWRNDELTENQGARPEGIRAEHSMDSQVVELHAPYRLVFTWGERGEVAFDLHPEGDHVRFTITHRRISDRANTLMVGAGWHVHLDVLVARLGGPTQPGTFWEQWQSLRGEYDQRLPQ